MLGKTVHPLVYVLTFVAGLDYAYLNLPEEHLPYFFYNNHQVSEKCWRDDNCAYKNIVHTEKCWGYEKNCSEQHRYSTPYCPENSRGWVRTKEEQINHFWRQGDFGYIKDRIDEMQVLCEAHHEDDTSLICAKYTRYCEAKNIFFDFRYLNADQEYNRYREDVIQEGQVGGFCKLYKDKLLAEGEHKSPLQSWFAELSHFTAFTYRPILQNKCDIVFDKPTYLIKLDAAISMFHHFCDFINLYASQHINHSFNTDVYIINWDTSGLPYRDFFEETWKVFTDHPLKHLKELDGKRVCFKEAVFPLLARMRLGMYYNMPLIHGCYGSGLFHAFSKHVIHRLHILQNGPSNKIRVTFLSRTTQYRRILNENELSNAMRTVGNFDVTLIDYNSNMPFLEQLKLTHNSDIFIGMHGSGLTHLLFLPDWAVVFEIYNCEDDSCYLDLARLRGVRYMTWERKEKLTQQDEGHHPTLGAHAKFTNYAFDVSEFMRLITISEDYVLKHPKYQAAKIELRAAIHDEL